MHYAKEIILSAITCKQVAYFSMSTVKGAGGNGLRDQFINIFKYYHFPFVTKVLIIQKINICQNS